MLYCARGRVVFSRQRARLREKQKNIIPKKHDKNTTS